MPPFLYRVLIHIRAKFSQFSLILNSTTYSGFGLYTPYTLKPLCPVILIHVPRYSVLIAIAYHVKKNQAFVPFISNYICNVNLLLTVNRYTVKHKNCHLFFLFCDLFAGLLLSNSSTF